MLGDRTKRMQGSVSIGSWWDTLRMRESQKQSGKLLKNITNLYDTWYALSYTQYAQYAHTYIEKKTPYWHKTSPKYLQRWNYFICSEWSMNIDWTCRFRLSQIMCFKVITGFFWNFIVMEWKEIKTFQNIGKNIQ